MVHTHIKKRKGRTVKKKEYKPNTTAINKQQKNNNTEPISIRNFKD